METRIQNLKDRVQTTLNALPDTLTPAEVEKFMGPAMDTLDYAGHLFGRAGRELDPSARKVLLIKVDDNLRFVDRELDRLERV